MDKISKNLKMGLITGSASLALVILIQSLDNFYPGFYLSLFTYIILPLVTIIYIFLGLFKKYIWLFGIVLIAVGTSISFITGQVAHICGSGEYVKPFWCTNTATTSMFIFFIAGFSLIIISVTKSIVSKHA